MSQSVDNVLRVGDRMRFSVKLIEQLRAYEDDPLELATTDVVAADIRRWDDGLVEIIVRRYDDTAAG